MDKYTPVGRGHYKFDRERLPIVAGPAHWFREMPARRLPWRAAIPVIAALSILAWLLIAVFVVSVATVLHH